MLPVSTVDPDTRLATISIDVESIPPLTSGTGSAGLMPTLVKPPLLKVILLSVLASVRVAYFSTRGGATFTGVGAGPFAATPTRGAAGVTLATGVAALRAPSAYFPVYLAEGALALGAAGFAAVAVVPLAVPVAVPVPLALTARLPSAPVAYLPVYFTLGAAVAPAAAGFAAASVLAPPSALAAVSVLVTVTFFPSASTAYLPVYLAEGAAAVGVSALPVASALAAVAGLALASVFTLGARLPSAVVAYFPLYLTVGAAG